MDSSSIRHWLTNSFSQVKTLDRSLLLAVYMLHSSVENVMVWSISLTYSLWFLLEGWCIHYLWYFLRIKKLDNCTVTKQKKSENVSWQSSTTTDRHHEEAKWAAANRYICVEDKTKRKSKQFFWKNNHQGFLKKSTAYLEREIWKMRETETAPIHSFRSLICPVDLFTEKSWAPDVWCPWIN